MRLLLAFLFAVLITPALAQQAEPTIGTQQTDNGDDAIESVQDGEQIADPFILNPNVAFEAFAAGNYPRAFDLAVIFAAREDPPAMRLLGQMYAGGFGVSRNETEAAHWYELASQAGDPQAQFLLATMKLDGVHIPHDATGAADLLRSAHEADFTSATQVLGMLMLEGRGVERDLAGGAQMMRQAAEAGDVTAQYTLGILYAEGAGVRQDTQEAFSWFERAARRGNPEAQIELALGLLSGQAADPDQTQDAILEEAVFWLRRAAEAGNPVAQNRLAHAHAQGYGVRLDPVLAAYYHARAVAGGLGDARLDSFVASLSPEQRQEAQDRMAAERSDQDITDQSAGQEAQTPAATSP